MGTSGGIAVLDTGTNTVAAIDPFVGKVLAVSPDGNTVILSNAAPDPSTGNPIQPDVPSQRLVILTGGNSLQKLVLPGAIAASFTGDSSKAYIAVHSSNPADEGRFYVFSPFQSLQTTSILTGAPVISDVATVASGEYSYFSTSTGLHVVATCNNAQQLPVPASDPPTNSTTLQQVDSIGNDNLIVVVDSPGIDIVNATLNSLLSANTPPFTLTTTNCAPPVSYSNEFVDFGIGAFTARQLITPSSGLSGTNGSHIVVLPAGTPKLLVAVPDKGAEVISLAGSATEAVSGSMTLDGNQLWVGAAGSNDVHQILLTNDPSKADALQIAMSFKKSDGSAAPPNIVVVKPH
jgi:hypothetical protein